MHLDLKRSPTESFILQGDWQLSYEDLRVRSGQYAQLLKSHEISKETLVVVATRDAEFVYSIFFAGLYVGAPVLFLDPQWSAAEVSIILNDVSIGLLLVDQELKKKWSLSDPNMSVIAVKKSFANRLFGSKEISWVDKAKQCEGLEPQEFAEDHPALILPTTGSTGKSKLALLSRKNLLAQAQLMQRHLRLDGSRLYNQMNLYHIDGLVTGAFSIFLAGATCFRYSRNDTRCVADQLAESQPTHWLAPPTVFAFCSKYFEDTFSWPKITAISTGAPLTDAVASRYEEKSGHPLYNLYGMTEIGNTIFCGPEPSTYKKGSLGFPKGCQTRVLDDELWVAGDTVVSGYLNYESPRDGPWFPTGDLVKEDDDGAIQLIGRKKNMLIVGGYNVSPLEIDQTIGTIEGVVEAATIGVDEEMSGQLPVSFVIAPNLTIGKLRDQLADKLVSYKIPKLILVDEIAKNRSGKVDVVKMQPLIRSSPSGTDIESRVLSTAQAAFQVDDLQIDSTPETVSSWDSLGHLRFVIGLENEFSIHIPPQQVMNIKSIQLAIDLITEETH